MKDIAAGRSSRIVSRKQSTYVESLSDEHHIIKVYLHYEDLYEAATQAREALKNHIRSIMDRLSDDDQEARCRSTEMQEWVECVWPRDNAEIKLTHCDMIRYRFIIGDKEVAEAKEQVREMAEYKRRQAEDNPQGLSLLEQQIRARINANT